MTPDHTDTDRRTFMLLAGAATLSLSGCLGGDGDDDDDGGDGSADGDGDGGGGDDGEPNGDGGTGTDENGTELSETGARETVSEFLSAISIGDVDAYNELLHSDGPIEPETDEGFLAPDIEIRSQEVTRHEDGEIVIEVALDYELGDVSGDRRWAVELRGEDGEWRVWSVTTGIGVDEPAQSPTVAVQEFLDILDQGDLEGALVMVHEDANFEGFFGENIDRFEAADLIVENDVVLDRRPGWARVAVDVKDGEDSVPEEWTFTLVVQDREWKIQNAEF